MASIVLNPAIQVISGDVAGFVYRHLADGSVIVAKARVPNTNYTPTEAQLAQLERFKEASARYTLLMQDAGVKNAYEQVLATMGRTARLRALVMGDILGTPAVDQVDLSAYQGQIGDAIKVVAEDNVGVSRLELVIWDTTANAAVETGHLDAEPGKRMVEWVYQTTAQVPTDHAVEVRVTAFDLAGNSIQQKSTK
jgi:hypothetical protein